MTQKPPAHAERYDTGVVVEQGEGFKVFAGTELSLNAPCFFHQFELPAKTTDHDRQLAVSVLKNYARLLFPHTPRLCDAWFADGFLNAIEFKWPAPAFDRDLRNPMAGANPSARRDLFERTLRLMSAVHSCNIVHGRVTEKSFGADPASGAIYLLDSGLDWALVRVLHRARDSFSLQEKLQARDLADWAFAFLSLQHGSVLYETPENDTWDQVDFKEVENRLQRDFKSGELAGFFLDCLGAFGIGATKYESATEALEFWERKNLKGLFR